MKRHAFVTGLLTAGLVVSGSLRSAAISAPEMDLEKKVAAVLPTAEEERWLQIPWRTSIADALADSRRTGKPVMLWVMNGNPLGCA